MTTDYSDEQFGYDNCSAYDELIFGNGVTTEDSWIYYKDGTRCFAGLNYQHKSSVTVAINLTMKQFKKFNSMRSAEMYLKLPRGVVSGLIKRNGVRQLSSSYWMFFWAHDGRLNDWLSDPFVDIYTHSYNSLSERNRYCTKLF